jgi:hypothetical protein
VLACFENIYQDLRRHGLLEKLLEVDHPTYELRIVGHSLVRRLAASFFVLHFPILCVIHLLIHPHCYGSSFSICRALEYVLY